MENKEQDARQKIIDTAKAILKEEDDPGKITVRQIARRAGVGTGLINYHFKSKDKLLSIAIGDVMIKMIRDFTRAEAYSRLSTREKLKAMLKELMNISEISEKVIRFALIYEITKGDMQSPLYLIPLLKEIFGDTADDMELRIIALQILHPIQIAWLNPKTFHMYSGVDLYNADHRNRFVDMLVDNLIQ